MLRYRGETGRERLLIWLDSFLADNLLPTQEMKRKGMMYNVRVQDLCYQKMR